MSRISRIMVLCLSFVWMSSSAQDDPAILANRFFSQKLAERGLKADFQFNSRSIHGNIWIFECLNPEGFVLVKQTSSSRVVGYSVGNRFMQNNSVPGPAEEFLKSLSAFEFTDTTGAKLKSTHHPIGPMIRTSWSQEGYFNYYCPEDPEGPDQHVYAGCAAVAMGQILRYFGKFNDYNLSVEMQDQKYGKLVAEVGNFDWFRMENHPIIVDLEVSRLLYSIGVLTSMNYGPTGSTTSNFNVYDSFKKLKYFNAVRMARATTDNNVWVRNFEQNISSFQPVYVSGSGHAFICDGIDSEGLFHFNLGWYGYADGYYPLNAVFYLIPSEAIFGLRPYSNNLPPLNLAIDSSGVQKILTWEKNPKSTVPADLYRVYLNDTLFFPTRDTFMNMSSFPPGNHDLMVSAVYMQGESVWIGPVQYQSESGPIGFSDDNLRMAILEELVRENIPLGTEAPTLNQVLHLKKLEINKPVSDLNGLRYCQNLQILKIRPETAWMADLAPISQLRRLKWLSLQNIDSTALSALLPDDRLIQLDLSFCRTGNLGFLSPLTRLLTIRMVDCQIPELQVISTMNSLTHLTISGCNLINASFIQSMTNLKAIDLSGNRIQRFRLPGALPELINLNVSHNLINELFFLENIPNIQSLDLGFNALDRFITGVNYRYLKELSLSGNAIDSIRIGVSWPAMKRLSLSRNKLENVKRLKDFMPELEWLDLSDNHIRDFWDGSLQQLDYLNFAGNSLTYLDNLPHNPTLRHIDLANNQVSDIHPIQGKLPESAYEYIDLTGNPLSAESMDRFAPTLLTAVDTLLLPDVPQPLSPCYPSPLRNQAVTGTEVDLSWTYSGSENPTRFDVMLGTSPDSMTIAGTTYNTNLPVSISAGRRYYWRVKTVQPDTSFLSGLYRFVTYQPINLPFKEGFETYPAFSYLTTRSDSWLKPPDTSSTQFDGRIDPFRKSEGAQGLKMMNAACVSLPMGHLYQSSLNISMQLLIGDGCLATVSLQGINGGDLDFHFKSNKRCDLFINGEHVTEIAYPIAEWIQLSIRLYSRGNEIWVKIGGSDLMIPWIFNGSTVNAEELVLSATPGKNYPTSGQALFYMDNLEIKASGALATNPGIQPAGISVYPNPANEVINIYIAEMTDTPQIRLVDATGRSIGLTINSEEQGSFRFDTSALAPGLYFFQIVSGSTRQTRRIFITH